MTNELNIVQGIKHIKFHNIYTGIKTFIFFAPPPKPVVFNLLTNTALLLNQYIFLMHTMTCPTLLCAPLRLPVCSRAK